MSDLKKVGKIGGKALLYFEIVTTLALIIGVVVAYFIQPGGNVDTTYIEKVDITKYSKCCRIFLVFFFQK
jgi:aerobic C4-dicarboxylate transport protein